MKADPNVTGDVAIREVLALFIVSLFKRFPVSLEQKWRKLVRQSFPCQSSRGASEIRGHQNL
jgi:hypothetical protein